MAGHRKGCTPHYRNSSDHGRVFLCHPPDSRHHDRQSGIFSSFGTGLLRPAVRPAIRSTICCHNTRHYVQTADRYHSCASCRSRTGSGRRCSATKVDRGAKHDYSSPCEERSRPAGRGGLGCTRTGGDQKEWAASIRVKHGLIWDHPRAGDLLFSWIRSDHRVCLFWMVPYNHDNFLLFLGAADIPECGAWQRETAITAQLHPCHRCCTLGDPALRLGVSK